MAQGRSTKIIVDSDQSVVNNNLLVRTSRFFNKALSLYDPQDPTPSLGGPSFNGFNAGVKNMRPLEWRKDVLAFDLTPPLTEDLVIVGEVSPPPFPPLLQGYLA